MAIRARWQQGVTLIELIIAIVVLGIAAVGILTALGRTTVLNVDPLLRAQSLSLAQSFMDEVSSKPFYRPENDPTLDPSLDADLTCDTEVSDFSDSRYSSANGAGELIFVAICDYHGYSSDNENDGAGGIFPANYASVDEEITALSAYSVSINIDTGNDIDQEPFTALDDECVLRIRVEVTDPSGSTTRLANYRTSYWEGCS